MYIFEKIVNKPEKPSGEFIKVIIIIINQLSCHSGGKPEFFKIPRGSIHLTPKYSHFIG